MMTAFCCVLCLLCVWLIAQPLLSPSSAAQATASDLELHNTERGDLSRFLDSIQFDLERGLISEAEFKKQQTKVKSRLSELAREVL